MWVLIQLPTQRAQSISAQRHRVQGAAPLVTPRLPTSALGEGAGMGPLCPGATGPRLPSDHRPAKPLPPGRQPAGSAGITGGFSEKAAPPPRKITSRTELPRLCPNASPADKCASPAHPAPPVFLLQPPLLPARVQPLSSSHKAQLKRPPDKTASPPHLCLSQGGE